MNASVGKCRAGKNHNITGWHFFFGILGTERVRDIPQFENAQFLPMFFCKIHNRCKIADQSEMYRRVVVQESILVIGGRSIAFFDQQGIDRGKSYRGVKRIVFKIGTDGDSRVMVRTDCSISSSCLRLRLLFA